MRQNMLTTDWKFDFSTLPRWDNREKIPYIYDEYYYVPDSDVLCCIYSISEVSMGNYLGFLAILQDRSNPTLLLNITEEFNFCNNFSASKDGHYLFLQPSIYKSRDNSIHRPVLVIDVLENKFAFITTDNLNPCYKVIELDKFNFKIEADENQKGDPRLDELCRKKIRIDRLEWHTLSTLTSLQKML